MPVEDHPIYAKWSGAFDHLIEAERRFYEALMRKDKALETYRMDRDNARKSYHDICDQIDADMDEKP